MKILRCWVRRAWFPVLMLLLAFVAAACGIPQPVPHGMANWLPQGWDATQQAWFHHQANQGSRLVPYRWFLHLEQADQEAPFCDPAHLDRLRYLCEPPDPAHNPDGLPVGFVQDDVPDAQGRRWLGFSCAACHTSQIDIQGVHYRIDGGQGQGDVQTLLEELTASLRKTLDEDVRFGRFADRVLGVCAGQQARDDLRKQLREVTQFREEFQRRNHTRSRYGYGRVDAFGIILNEVLARALQVPSNRRDPDAPVSYPCLWDTPQHDFVQWNGSAPNHPLGTHFVGPLSRNVGEVLGVFGDLEVKPGGHPFCDYHSSARRLNLLVIEELLRKLQSPQWPRDLPIDDKLAARGRGLYEQHCIQCHADLQRDSLTRTVEAKMTPLSVLNTDAAMAENYANRTADPGVLRGQRRLFFVGPAFGGSAPAGELLLHVTAGVILQQPPDLRGPWQTLEMLRLFRPQDIQGRLQDYQDVVQGITRQDQSALLRRILAPLAEAGKKRELLAYKGRPLNGIWATAPYLHNGSVPNLYQLLLPPQQRVTRFYVGSREFDAENVGFVSDVLCEGAFEFRVKDDAGNVIPGNSNAGHDYGTRLSPDDRHALLEYLKTR